METQPSNKLLTLLFVMDSDRILLGMKKRGFGAGRWNGFGGKVQVDQETIEEAAVRETKEECGLVVSLSQLDKVGVIIYEDVVEPPVLEVHVFRTERFSGVVTESEEMRPQWFKHTDIPFDTMWPDDILWYPHLLAKEYLDAFFKFEGYDTILDYSISVKS